MFRHFTLVFAVLCASVSAGDFVTEIGQPIDRMFVPKGYDTNDTLRVMVEGRLPSACYQISRADSIFDEEKNTIEIQLTANEYSGNCPKISVPFHYSFLLGRIKTAGTYTIVDLSSRKELGTVQIQEAKPTGPGTDDLMYMPLLDAFLVKEGGKNFVHLRGVFPSHCMRYKGLKVEVQADVVVILPQAAYRPMTACSEDEVPFERKIELPVELPKHSYLLHVRSLGGQAIEKMMHPTP